MQQQSRCASASGPLKAGRRLGRLSQPRTHGAAGRHWAPPAINCTPTRWSLQPTTVLSVPFQSNAGNLNVVVTSYDIRLDTCLCQGVSFYISDYKCNWPTVWGIEAPRSGKIASFYILTGTHRPTSPGGNHMNLSSSGRITGNIVSYTPLLFPSVHSQRFA